MKRDLKKVLFLTELEIVLKSVKSFIIKNPNADWEKVFNNVKSNYGTKKDLSGILRMYKGFYIEEFKKTLK